MLGETAAADSSADNGDRMMRTASVWLGIVVLVCVGMVVGCRKEEAKPSPAPKGKTEPLADSTAPAKPAMTPAPTGMGDKTAPAAPREKADPVTKAPTPEAISTPPDETPKTAAGAAAPSVPRGPMRLGDDRNPQEVAAAKTKRPGSDSGSKAGTVPARRRTQPPRSPSSPAPNARRSSNFKPINMPDVMFHCPSCNAAFTMPSSQGYPLIASARRKNPKGRPQVTCTKCGKKTALPAVKCVKCGAIRTAPKKMDLSMRDGFFDECKACGYSRMRENIIRGLKKRKASGRPLNLEKARPHVRRAIEDAKARGEWED